MKVLRIAGGLLLGLLTGAALVLLFAPRSGVETRQLVQDWIRAVLDEGRGAADARRLELTAQFEALKAPSKRF